MNSEWRGKVNELKDPGVDTQATYAMARLKGSLGGSPVKCPQRHSTHARRSLRTSELFYAVIAVVVRKARLV
jgi:hypothetical protein